MRIEINDMLLLEDIDNPVIQIKEKVVSIYNPKTEDTFFQIRTENYDYDFQNFFNIIEIIKSK